MSMAFKCIKYNKILVGPRKTCESCKISNLESECEYRIWQDGVLKVKKEKKRSHKQPMSSMDTEPLPMAIGLDISDLTNSKETYLRYMLGKDEKYYYLNSIPENLNTQEIYILEVLTKGDIKLVREKNWRYSELLKLKELL